MDTPSALETLETLDDVLFRASVDEPFRQSLLAGARAGQRFVETATERDDAIVLPRRIEDGTRLTPDELGALAVVGGTGERPPSCWITDCTHTCTITVLLPPIEMARAR